MKLDLVFFLHILLVVVLEEFYSLAVFHFGVLRCMGVR